MANRPYITERTKMWRLVDHKPAFEGTLDNIEKSGWEAMLIDGNEVGLRFAYTVGIHDTHKFPEIIVVGLKSKTAHLALQYSIEALQNDVDLTVGRHREIVGEVEVIFRRVSRKWYEHVVCRNDWYYSGSNVPALQLIYPDLDGRFQEEEGFTEYFRQPLLQPDVVEGRTERDFWASNDPESSLFRWKFSDPPHTSVFLSRGVHERGEAVTFVAHNRSDSTWEFLGPSMVQEGELPVISCFHHQIDNDVTLEDLHDLPLGWFATREKPGAQWCRFKEEHEDTSNRSTNQ